MTMTFTEALAEIRGFWNEPEFPLPGSGDPARLAALEQQFGRAFPDEARAYIGTVLSADGFCFSAVGNPFDVYGHARLSKRAEGYNHNPVTGQPIEGWSDDWLLIGDEGADPIIIDLARAGPACPVLQALHGAGDWDFGAIADSLPQFLLLCAARHHALMMLDVDSRIIDDENGFNLGAAAADWLFPRVRRWAPAYYDDWVGTFDNA